MEDYGSLEDPGHDIRSLIILGVVRVLIALINAWKERRGHRRATRKQRHSLNRDKKDDSQGPEG